VTQRLATNTYGNAEDFLMALILFCLPTPDSSKMMKRILCREEKQPLAEEDLESCGSHMADIYAEQ
jgi:hypothetical protein